jgi:hypothetical protein
MFIFAISFLSPLVFPSCTGVGDVEVLAGGVDHHVPRHPRPARQVHVHVPKYICIYSVTKLDLTGLRVRCTCTYLNVYI